MGSTVTYNAIVPGGAADELYIRRMDSLEASARQILTSKTYFAGGSVLVCHAGAFVFSFLGEKRPVRMNPGETLVIYPGNTVTIESLQHGSVLKYAVFDGKGVADFFDSFGFYDRLLFEGETQLEAFENALRESATNPTRALAYLQDALATFGNRLRTSPQKRLHAALRAIDRAHRSGRANVKTICSEINVSRTTLNRLFEKASLGSPCAYIQQHIARQAIRLLTTTETPIAEIAHAVGIDAPAYFTEFMRRQTGTTPSALRKNGLN